jgi:hypothetical protein
MGCASTNTTFVCFLMEGVSLRARAVSVCELYQNMLYLKNKMLSWSLGARFATQPGIKPATPPPPPPPYLGLGDRKK